ncbi:MAG: hypothetical protein II821_02910 [Treponema sp.]|nr:hypothetical protein [Treponema sp.]
MKKLSLSAFVLTGITMILSGCGSTQISLNEQTPSAVISIIGNTQIPWVDHESEETTPTGEPEAESTLTSLATSFIASQDPEVVTAVDRLDYIYDSIAQNLPDLTGIQVLPKDEVISSEAYKRTTSSYFNTLSATKKATKFKDLSTIGSKSARVLLNSLGAKSAILASATFQKDLNKGTRSNGTIKGIATLKIKMLNEKGKEITNKIYVSETQPVRIIGGDYDKDELVSLMNEAIDGAVRQFCMDLSNTSTDEVLSSSENKAEAAEETKATPIKMKTPVKTTTENETTENDNVKTEIKTDEKAE